MKNNKNNQRLNLDLYSDNNPITTIKGFGFKNKQKAEETIEKLKKGQFTITYIKQVIITMFYRAKHHPNRTKDMEEAMKVFKKANKDMKLDINLV
jgi:hypothetical protein